MNNIDIDNCIALDIGTTNSCVACWTNGEIRIVQDINHSYFPSLVSINNYQVSCGDSAKIYEGRENCAYQLKRMIGRAFNDNHVQKLIERWPFTVSSGRNGVIEVTLKDNQNEYTFSVNVLYSFFIKYLKDRAEEFLGHPVTQAIITIPAVFSDIARETTIICAEAVGLNVVHVLEEPVAAAITYANRIMSNSRILVYDFGGGTFDVCILEVTENERGEREYKKICTAGDPFLGGEDLNPPLSDYIKRILLERNIPFDEKKLEKKLGKVAEECKIFLSSHPNCDTVPNGLDIDESIIITREELERIIRPYIEKTIEIVDDCIADAHLNPSDINSVILIGGSSQIPMIKSLLSKRFIVKSTVNVEEAVARGAMIYAVGKHKAGGVKEIHVPAMTNMRYVTRLPHDAVYTLIDRGVECPFSESRLFETYRDNQSFISIPLAQGNSEYFSQNQFLGSLVVKSIPRRPKGEVRVEITSTIDKNGIIHFSAQTMKMRDFPSVKAEVELMNNAPPHNDEIEYIQTTIQDTLKNWEEVKQKQERKKECGQQLENMRSLLEKNGANSDAWYFYTLEKYWFDEVDASKEDYDTVINSIVRKMESIQGGYYGAAV